MKVHSTNSNDCIIYDSFDKFIFLLYWLFKVSLYSNSLNLNNNIFLRMTKLRKSKTWPDSYKLVYVPYMPEQRPN